MVNSFFKIVTFILLVLLLVLLFQNYLLKKENNKAFKNSTILPKDIKQEIVVKKDKVYIKEKVKNKSTGTEEVKADIKYIPPEGELKISVKETGDVEYKLSNKGFTFTPGIIVIPSDHTDVGVAVRLAYWNRLGAGVGTAISIEDSPKASILGILDYRFYGNFAIGVAYKESFTNRKLGASFSYYF